MRIEYLVFLRFLIAVDFEHIVDLKRVVSVRFRMSSFDVLIDDRKFLLIRSKDRDIRFELLVMRVDRILLRFLF